MIVEIEIDRRLMHPDHNPEALWDFVQSAWPYMGDPSPLTATKYMHVLCAHLQAVARREAPDLLINIPPSHSKSVLCNILYPAWVWTWRPQHRFGCLSYDEKLVLRDAVKCRKLIESDWYQARWPLSFQPGSNAKGYYTNEHGGSRVSTTIRSGITGSHFDDILVDDPQNPTKLGLGDADDAAAEAETARFVWDVTLPSRVVSPEHSRRIVIMQRLSELDLTQHILDQGHKLKHLMLPLFFDPERACEADWRTEEGELLAPERYTKELITEQVLAKLADAAVAAQYQQDPTAEGAGLFDISDFPTYKAWEDLPSDGLIGISIDGATSGRAKGKAAKAEAARSRWAITAWLRSEGNTYLLDAEAFREDFDVVLVRLESFVGRLTDRVRELTAARRAVQRRHAGSWVPQEIIVERKSTGEAAVSMFKGLDLRDFDYELWDVGTSKVERASAVLRQVRAGKVILPEGLLTAEHGTLKIFRDEIKKFPRGKSDDLVDTMSQILLFWQAKFGEEEYGDLDRMLEFARAL